MAEWKSETITLAYPIPAGGGSDKEITSITFIEPDVEVLEKLEELDFETGKKMTYKQLRHAIAYMSRTDPEIIKKVQRDDFTKLCEAVLPFISGSDPSMDKTDSTKS